jgi:galactokinase
MATNHARSLRLFSEQQPGMLTLSPGELASDEKARWSRYLVGVLLEMDLANLGLDVYISSTLPMQRGLASSAAITVAFAAAVQHMSCDDHIIDMPALCQRVEQIHVGVQCGPLDQYSVFHATSGNLLLIDCATLTHCHVPFPEGLSIVVCDSGIRRELRNSRYNARRAECQQLAQLLGRPTLRGVTVAEMERVRVHAPVLFRRGEHVARENERVKQMVSAIERGDLAEAKGIMVRAHRSCRDLYECSSPELDFLVNTAAGLPGCVGARLTGAGWGGSTINIVLHEDVPEFCRVMAAEYARHTQSPLTCYVIPRPTAGASWGSYGLRCP